MSSAPIAPIITAAARSGGGSRATVRRILPPDYAVDSDRLTLRPFRRDEGEILARLAADRRIGRWTQVLPEPVDRAGATSFIEDARRQAYRGLDYAFAVERRDDGRLIGCMGLHPAASAPLGRLGYWLGTDHWGYGYGTEAIGAALAIAFGALRLHRIEADAHEDNIASWRSLEKAGLRFERRTRRPYPSSDAGTVPVKRYGLSKAEWRTLAAGRVQPVAFGDLRGG